MPTYPRYPERSPVPATGRWDVTIWLHTSQPGSQDAEHDADIILDLYDGTWPQRPLTAL